MSVTMNILTKLYRFITKPFVNWFRNRQLTKHLTDLIYSYWGLPLNTYGDISICMWNCKLNYEWGNNRLHLPKWINKRNRGIFYLKMPLAIQIIYDLD
jgi:hypothetical protein